MRRVAKILLGTGVVFGSLLILIPVFVQVDDYRPKIVSLANEHINGNLSLGKLSLSLWGQVRVNVDGAKLSDARGREILSVKDVFFHIPFTSFLTGSPLLTLKMQEPHLFIVKDKAGKLNAVSVVKASPKTAVDLSTKTEEKKSQGGEAPSGGAKELPGIAKRARLGIEMKKALLSYEDQKTELKSEVKDLNVSVKDISLSRTMIIQIAAEVDTKVGKTVAVKGPVALNANVTPTFEGTEFKASDLSFKVDLNGLEILMPGVFEKTKSIKAEGSGELSVSKDSADLKDLKFRFHNAEVAARGKISGLSSEKEPSVNLSLKSNEIDFKPWNALIPPLKEYDLGGTLGLDFGFNGTPSKPKYNGEVKAKRLTAKAKQLKAQPVLDAQVKIATEQVDLGLEMKAPGNDLRVQGKVISFSKPRVDVSILSTGLDLDQLVEFPNSISKPAEAKTTADTKSEASDIAVKQPTAKGEKGAQVKSADDFDSVFAPLRENSVAKNTVATLQTKVNFIKIKGVKLTELQGKVDYRNLTLKIDGFRFGVFSGTVKKTALLEMGSIPPKYSFDVEVNKLNLQEAVTSQFALFKNTLLGTASFKMEGRGASLNIDPLKKNLNTKGTLKVENATFATIDIGKAVAEGLSKSVQQLGEKVPPLKGKNIGTPQNMESKYSLVTADFSISNGKFTSPNFYAKAEPNHGLDLKGNTELSILDYGLSAQWEVIDTYNLTKAKDLSVEQQGVRVEHILADSDGFVHIPIKVGGTAFKPEMNYGSIAESLGKVALNNSSKAVAGKAKVEAKKKIDEVIQKQAPPQVQDALKSFGGKLFGN